MQLARRLQQIKPSPTLALNAKARALAAQGVDVVGFAAGEPDYDTPAFIKDAAVEALRQGPHPGGELSGAIADEDDGCLLEGCLLRGCLLRSYRPGFLSRNVLWSHVPYRDSRFRLQLRHGALLSCSAAGRKLPARTG